MTTLTRLVFLISLIAQTTFAGNPVFESEGEKFQFEVLIEQKDVVWGFDFLDKNRIIFTERSGALRVLDLATKTVSDIKGAPLVYSSGQGGLLDVRVHPTQKTKIYLSYAEPMGDGATTALAMATLEGNQLNHFKKIFSANEPNKSTIQFGSRIEFDNKGHIFLSVGDRNYREQAQDLALHNGKILRLNEDGSIPKDNPFLKTKGAKPEIWSYGHRNPQGLVRNATTDELWSTEMGPQGGDELNLIRPGLNYGWPVITYGREYTGGKIGEGTAKKGMEQPTAYWVPSISPSSVTLYTGKVFPKWTGDIFIGALSGTHLHRVKVKDQQVVSQGELLKDLYLRIRNVRTGPEGYLYLSTDDGKIARLINSK